MIDTGERIKFLKSLLGSCEASKDGINFSFSCPECDKEKQKKKLVIKIETGQWHCWVCEIKGKNVHSLIKKFYPQKYNEWCSRFEEQRRALYKDDEEKKEEKVQLPDDCLNIEELQSSNDPDAKAILNYLEERGVSEDIAYRFRIMGCIYGRLRQRVVIPSFDKDGELNYWTSRSIDKDAKFKYINPKVDRFSIIFNEVDVDWHKEITLVEGPFDMIKSCKNTVPLLGSTLNRSSILFSRIVEHQTPVTIALDKDAIEKSHKIAKNLYQYNISIKFLEMESDRDIGDMKVGEYENISSNAYEWSPMNRLLHKISSISSGSLI